MAKMGRGMDPSKLQKNREIPTKTRIFFGFILLFIFTMMFVFFFTGSGQRYEQREVVPLQKIVLQKYPQLSEVASVLSELQKKREQYAHEGEIILWLYREHYKEFEKYYETFSPRALLYFLEHARIVHQANFCVVYNEDQGKTFPREYLASALKKMESDTSETVANVVDVIRAILSESSTIKETGK